jgi:CHAT domain-containing protein
VQSGFRANYAAWYLDLEDALLAQNQSQQAYHVSERYRARSFLQMLAERDLVFASDVPPDLRLARKRNAADYDRVQSQISALNPAKDQKSINELLTRLRDLNIEREQIAEQIKRTSPRFASLEYAQPLDLAGTRQVLDSATILLSYSVCHEHTVLFVVQPPGTEPGISVFNLPIREKELEARVHEFRRLIQEHRGGGDHDLVALARQFYDLLLKPAESLLAGCDRLLIVPDGSLQILPFASTAEKRGAVPGGVEAGTYRSVSDDLWRAQEDAPYGRE